MTSTIKTDGWLLATVLTATFIGQFDFFVVNVAAPDIQSDLAATNTQLELVVAGYAFMYASGLITGGRLGDLHGRRRVFITGLVAFAITSTLCGLAPNVMTLIVCRALQGLSAAVLLPQVLAFISTAIPAPRRGWAMGWFGVASGIGSIAGQGLGGFLVEANLWHLRWRLVFLVNVPIMVIAIVATLTCVPPTPRRIDDAVDVGGATAIFVGMAGLMGAALLTQHHRGPAAVTAGVAGIAILLAAIRWQVVRVQRGKTVTLDPTLFMIRSMRWGGIACAAFMAYFASFMFVLTVVLQRHSGLDPIAAGLVFVPSGATFMLGSLTGSRWIPQHLRQGLISGCAMTGLGLTVTLAATTTGVPADDLPWWLVVAVSLTGFGNGFVLPTLTGLSLSEVDPNRAGMASGVVTTLQQFGASLGVAAVAALFYAIAGAASLRQGMAAAVLVHLALLVIVGATCLTATRRHPVQTRG
ncbi:MFS transporter [Cutibacterium sp. WCA-380-WT-3A]|uniref:MFS transporter n=1 Tax=Cutibacterium porci TaxID=2605781 RepID=A0A7K0J5G2_9ACTN|nr:MFS transporter [Cutibacterium porci]MSS45175.1 MFS transporter [Cutibacterium porci]